MTSTGISQLRRRLAALVLALGALVLLGALRCPWPVPGEWTGAVGAALGAHPFAPMSHPVWSLLVAAAGWLAGPVGGLEAIVWFSALAMAAAVTLVAWDGTRAPAGSPHAGNAGWPLLAAGLFGLATLPVLFVATRAHPLALDALLAAGAWTLLRRHAESGRRAPLLGGCLLLGAGCADAPAFLLLLAPAAGWLGWTWWRNRRPAGVLAGLALAAFALGLSLIALAAWRYAASPLAAWREFAGYGEVLQYMLRDHARSLRTAVPQLGWLLVVLLNVLPALALIYMRREAPRDAFARAGRLALLLALLAAAALTLFGGPGSPWRIGGAARPLVLPCLLTAWWVGRLLTRLEEASAPSPGSSRGQWRWVLRSVVALALLAAFARHLPRLRPADARVVAAAVDQVLDAARGRSWLVSDGVLDDALRLRAAQRGQPIEVVSAASARQPTFARYLASRLPTSELRSIAPAGLGPLLEVWAATDPDWHRQLAGLGLVGALRVHGLSARVEGLVYLAEPAGGGLPDARYPRTERVRLTWLSGEAAEVAAGDSLFNLTARWLLRLYGVSANELGIYLEEHQRPADAAAAYRLATRCDPMNRTPFLNLAGLEPAGASTSALARARYAAGTARGAVGELGRGLAALQRGQLAAGEESVRAALRGLPQTNSALPALVGRLLPATAPRALRDDLRAEALSAPPTNRIVLQAAFYSALRDGAVGDAARWLDRLQAAGAGVGELGYERGLLAAAREDAPAAQAIWEKALVNRADPRISLALGWLGWSEGNTGLVRRAEAQLARADTFLPGLLFQADLAAWRGDQKALRTLIAQAAREAPEHPAVLEKLAMFALADRRLREAEQLAGRLLVRSPWHPVGNYVLAAAQRERGEGELAEASLRRSLQGRPTVPALNDLAWLLQERGRLEEALGYAAQAVALGPGQPEPIGTQAMILQKLGRVQEAARAFEQEQALRARDPRTLQAARDASSAGEPPRKEGP